MSTSVRQSPEELGGAHFFPILPERIREVSSLQLNGHEQLIGQSVEQRVYLTPGETIRLSTAPQPRLLQRLTHQKIINPVSRSTFRVSAHENGVDVTRQDRQIAWLNSLIMRAFFADPQISVNNQELAPFDSRLGKKWQMGTKPGSDKVVFSDHQSIFGVEFLGHPDQSIGQVLAAQAADYKSKQIFGFPHPDQESVYDRKNGDKETEEVILRVWRTILKTTPVLRTTFTDDIYLVGNKRQPFSYPTDLMVYIELQSLEEIRRTHLKEKTQFEPTRLRISVVTKAQTDQRLRVYSSSWSPLYSYEPLATGETKKHLHEGQLAVALSYLHQISEHLGQATGLVASDVTGWASLLPNWPQKVGELPVEHAQTTRVIEGEVLPTRVWAVRPGEAVKKWRRQRRERRQERQAALKPFQVQVRQRPVIDPTKFDVSTAVESDFQRLRMNLREVND